MGQKANATALRVGIIKDWTARYYAPSKELWGQWLIQDKKIRNFFDTKRREFGLDKVEIERLKENDVKIILTSAKPGVILGQSGENIKELELKLAKTLKDRQLKITIDVVEIKNQDLSAQLAADEIAEALENRGSFRLAQKRVIRKVMFAGAKGIKTRVSGRLNGVDMARAEGYSHGVVPLQTFRNDIDYATAEAKTTYGIIGIKVWISKGEVINGKNELERNPVKKDARKFNNRRNFNDKKKPEAK